MKDVSGSVVKPALIGLCAVLLLIAGCGKKETDRPQGQVIAHIGPDDVTVQELDNEFRLANIPADKRTDELTRKALLEIVTRKALTRQSVSAKIDREPTIQLDLLRNKEQMLARAMQQRRFAAEIAGIGQADLDQYITTHPAQFAKRVVLTTDEIEIPAQAVTQALVDSTKDAKTLAEIEARLKAFSIVSRRGPGVLDGATLPPQLLKQFLTVKGDDVFFTRSGNSGVFFKITDIQQKPLTGTEANELARQMIRREKFETIVRSSIDDAKKSATFEGDYARIMKDATAADASGGDAAPAAPAEAPGK